MTTMQAPSHVVLHGHDTAYLDLVGPGEPVVLIHGIASCIESWGTVPYAVQAAGHRVIALDLIGHGESGRGHGDYSLGANANVVRDLLNHLGVGQAHLVGHSLGGGIALQFLHTFPERVATLTLVSSGGLGVEAWRGLRRATVPWSALVIRGLTSEPVVGAGNRLGSVLRGAGFRHDLLSEPILEGLPTLRDPAHRDAFLATLRSVVGPEGQKVSGLQALSQIDPGDLLIIWGERDGIIPVTHGERAHELAQGSRLVVFPGAGHHPHRDDPERFAQLIAEHVAARAQAA